MPPDNAMHRSIANKLVGQPLTFERPDKLRATRTGGFANVEMVFDGKNPKLARQERQPVYAGRSARHDRSFGRRVAGQIPQARSGGGSADVGSAAIDSETRGVLG
jgi:uncharacterized protein DUF2092